MAIESITRVSADAEGNEGNSKSTNPDFSPDDTKVAFVSQASNLVPGDTNNLQNNLDGDASPPPETWSITPQNVRVNEAAGTVTFTVSRSGSTAAQTVYLSTVENEGAINEDDYVGKLNEPVVFAADEQSKTVSVTIIDDATVAEPDETFGLIVQAAPDDPPTEVLTSATFTIEDNDP